MAAGSGTTAIVATPHANLVYRFDPAAIRDRVEDLNRATGSNPLIYEGCDFHLTYDNVQDAVTNPAKYAINHKNYLLIEFSDLLIFNNTTEILESLQAAGLVPILTHPERNSLLQQRLDQLRAWVAQGCLIQVTALSLLGGFGKTAGKFSLALMEQGLVHFVASDAHDTKHRPPVLSEACEWTRRQFGEEVARSLFVDNPEAAVLGKQLPPPPSPSRRAWYHFW
jgi:protein-tyrosine phosphatase